MASAGLGIGLRRSDNGTRHVCVVPGDDAAPEAVRAAMRVLRHLNPPIEWEELPDGETLHRRHSRAECERLVKSAADRSDAILFGATSGRTAGIGYFRWGRNTYANVRVVRWLPGFRSPLANPEGIDYVVVRENTEDVYVGLEGDAHRLLGEPGNLLAGSRIPLQRLADGPSVYALKLFTQSGIERIAEFACRIALARQQNGFPGKVTCSAKYNMLPQSDGLFCRVVEEVVSRFPTLRYEQYIIDDFSRRVVANPQALDVVVLPNLYGDIISDEAAGTIGGLGLTGSGCYGDTWAYFEPVHGTAPDIQGEGIINPTATLASAVMMLEYLACESEARTLGDAITQVYATGSCLPHDQGGTASTEEFADAVIAAL